MIAKIRNITVEVLRTKYTGSQLTDNMFSTYGYSFTGVRWNLMVKNRI